VWLVCWRNGGGGVARQAKCCSLAAGFRETSSAVADAVMLSGARRGVTSSPVMGN